MSLDASTSNYSSALDPEPDTFEWGVPLWGQIAWITFFSFLVLLSLVGNSVVIWIILSNKNMRTVTNYFLISLSISDILTSTTGLPSLYFLLYQNWIFGSFYCNLAQFIAVLCNTASVLSLTAIAFDRYAAVITPFKPKKGKGFTLSIAGIIWIIGGLVASPGIFFYTKIDVDESTSLCVPSWPQEYQKVAYDVFLMVALYFVPIIIMGYTYTVVGINLWGSKSIGECTQRQLDSIQSKRKIVKMMIVVVVIFGVCWIPMHTYFIVTSLWPSVQAQPFIQELFLAIFCLASVNSMYHPIVYCWMNETFRRGFKSVFRWCPLVPFDAELESGVTRTSNV